MATNFVTVDRLERRTRMTILLSGNLTWFWSIIFTGVNSGQVQVLHEHFLFGGGDKNFGKYALVMPKYIITKSEESAVVNLIRQGGGAK